MSISYAGYRTGFPFPIADADTPPDYRYQFGYTPAQLAEFFWRANELQCVAQYSATATAGGVSFLVDTEYYLRTPAFGKEIKVSDIATPYAVPSDAWLAMPHSVNLTTAVRINHSFDTENELVVGYFLNPVAPTSGDVWGRVFMIVDFSLTKKIGGLYYPAIDLTYFASTDQLIGGVVPSAAGVMSSETASGGPTIAVTICGVTVNMDAVHGSPDSFGSNPCDSASGSIIINPVSYWSYNGKWNTSTGAPN